RTGGLGDSTALFRRTRHHDARQRTGRGAGDGHHRAGPASRSAARGQLPVRQDRAQPLDGRALLQALPNGRASPCRAPGGQRQRLGCITMIFDFDTITPEAKSKLLHSTIVPRPIAWVTSLDADGHRNMAPFSFFNVFSTDPPILGFSITASVFGGPKDTAA